MNINITSRKFRANETLKELVFKREKELVGKKDFLTAGVRTGISSIPGCQEHCDDDAPAAAQLWIDRGIH